MMDMDIDEFSYKDDEHIPIKSHSTQALDLNLPSSMHKPKDYMKASRLSPTSQSSITSLTTPTKFDFDEEDKQTPLMHYDTYRTESIASFISVSDLNVRSFFINRQNVKKRKIFRYFEQTVQCYRDNQIVTSKYNLLTFLPLNLMVQFSKMANLYFLILSVMECFPLISDSGGFPILLFPLGFVVGLSMIKDIYEDYQRHQSDKEENNRKAVVATPHETESLEEIKDQNR